MIPDLHNYIFWNKVKKCISPCLHLSWAAAGSSQLGREHLRSGSCRAWSGCSRARSPSSRCRSEPPCTCRRPWQGGIVDGDHSKRRDEIPFYHSGRTSWHTPSPNKLHTWIFLSRKIETKQNCLFQQLTLTWPHLHWGLATLQWSLSGVRGTSWECSLSGSPESRCRGSGAPHDIRGIWPEHVFHQTRVIKPCQQSR